MNAIILSLASISSFSGDIIYIGDYTSYQLKSIDNAIIHRSPIDILNSIKETDFKNVTEVVLSTGIANSCGSYKIVERQLDELAKKNVKFTVIKDNSCMGVSSVIQRKCDSIKYCSYKESYEI